MKRYVITDSDGWVSNCVFKFHADARHRAEKLITMDGWQNTKYIYVYELDVGNSRNFGDTFILMDKLNREEMLKAEADDEYYLSSGKIK